MNTKVSRTRSMMNRALAGLALLGAVGGLAQAQEQAKWVGGFGGGDSRSTGVTEPVQATNEPRWAAGCCGGTGRGEQTVMARSPADGRTPSPAGWGGEAPRREAPPRLYAHGRAR
jgi:hypothetical protein